MDVSGGQLGVVVLNDLIEGEFLIDELQDILYGIRVPATHGLPKWIPASTTILSMSPLSRPVPRVLVERWYPVRYRTSISGVRLTGQAADAAATNRLSSVPTRNRSG